MRDVGAFKSRGALNALMNLSERDRAKGVVTHSSGNHGQALAWAAKKFGTRAYIVMPSNAKEIKKRGIREFGGNIIECEPTQCSREDICEQVRRETGALLVHPFNDDAVIAGQATAAWELMRMVPEQLDAIVVPVGGGGLISGTALAAHAFSPATEIIGAEPSGADDAYRSLQAGRIIKNETVNTIADGLRSNLGDKTFAIMRKHVDQILLVDDHEIAEAMRILGERLRAVVEPSGAVPYAAIRKYPDVFAGKRVGIILSGGNVDPDNIPFPRRHG